MTSPSNPQCIITGCGLLCEANGEYYWGDLHTLDSVYIFHAANGSDPSWPNPLQRAQIKSQNKLITAHEGFFKRDNVIVFPRNTGTLNTLAMEYLNAAPNVSPHYR